MTRVTLILNPADATSYHATYLRSAFEPWFDICEYDPDRRYSRSGTVAVTGAFNTSQWYRPLQEQGIAVVVENLWEREYWGPERPGCHILTALDWFRYNEPLWYQWLGYDQYQPRPRYQYQAFMPIRKTTRARDRLVELLGTRLDRMLWSYVSQGRALPQDLPSDIDSPVGDFQRYYRPEWYDSTAYSIVAETLVDSGALFITEKSYKPMAFYHPMAVWGQAGVIQGLREQGFATWDNLWDESYDRVPSFTDRLPAMLAATQDYQPRQPDAVTLEKTRHNHAVFYDTKRVLAGIRRTAIDPVLELAG